MWTTSFACVFIIGHCQDAMSPKSQLLMPEYSLYGSTLIADKLHLFERIQLRLMHSIAQWDIATLPLSHAPHLHHTPPNPPSPLLPTTESGDSVYVTRLAPPIPRFCPNRAFCVAGAPDIKQTSSPERGKADVGAESPRVRGLGGGSGECFSIANIDMRRINPPRPPFFFRPPSPFYVGVGALGAPLHRRSPRLYKLPASRVTPPDLRAPDIWARDGFYSCRQTHTPNRGRDPSSLRSATEPGAVAKPKKSTKDRSKHETGVNTCSEHSLRWQSNKLDRVITTIQYSDSTSRERVDPGIPQNNPLQSAQLRVSSELREFPLNGLKLSCIGPPKELRKLAGTRSMQRFGTSRTCSPSPMWTRHGSPTYT